MLKQLIPTQSGRVPITLNNVIPIALPPILLYLFICYLVRRPGTYAFRLALTPLLVPWLLYITFGMQWFPPHTMALNVPFTTTGVLFAVRAAEYGLTPSGRFKLGEKVPGERPNAKERTLFHKAWDGLSDAVELTLSQRGMGWDFGTGEGLRLPPMQGFRPVHDRAAWLRATVFQDIFLNYLIVDTINTWWRTIPEVHTPLPPEKGFQSLSLAMRLAVPGTVMLVVVAYMSMWYEVAAVLDVAIFRRDPSAWPVLFGLPWRAQSLHDVWAKEWHQLSRRTFLSTLGYPLRALFGTPGMMFGVFLASGIYHNLMLIGDGQPGINIPTISFFALQAVGVTVERLARQITGRKVGGRLGNIWVIAFLLVTVQPFAQVWLDRGYLETSPIPARFSLVERIVGILL